MKNIFKIAAILTAGLSLAACNSEEFLNTSSPSTVDPDFVFSNMESANAAMVGIYDSWDGQMGNAVFGNGSFYATDMAGSDIERHPEAFANQLGRHHSESMYQNGKFASQYGINLASGCYSGMFSIIGKANAVITAIEGKSDFEEMMNSTEASDLGQLYGEAICARAVAYRELLRYYGDVPYATIPGKAANGLAPRDSVYDVLIRDLGKVIPKMHVVGQVPKNHFSKTFAQALAARLCLEGGGYQTRRADLGADFYKDIDGKTLTFEAKGKPNSFADNAVYGRRSDWKSLITKAKAFYEDLMSDSGAAVWVTVDPRAAEGKRVYNNPYQWFFQQNNDLVYSDESIYESAITQGASGRNSERPYALGRPSNGGSKFNYPCKSYGQGRINPAYYYGMFDPKDMRRDVSITATGSSGQGEELLIPFAPNSKASGGGLVCNKWDENRMSRPYINGQRKAGIHGPYMRMSEVYLGYAEVCAMLGDNGTAMTYLKKVRERAFPAGEAKTEEFVAKYDGNLHRAIIEERGFEYAAEGDRRWTLIRSGFLPEAIKNIKEMTADMINGLKANGYYTFPNGNTISNSVYVKTVDAKAEYGFRLTAQCTDESDPVLFPGWRGQNDSWETLAEAAGQALPKAGNKTNLAIKGLFEKLSEEEIAALKEDGYTEKPWGSDLVKYEDEYLLYLFYEYDYESAPIYFFPHNQNTLVTGGFTNGYGFKQEEG